MLMWKEVILLLLALQSARADTHTQPEAFTRVYSINPQHQSSRAAYWVFFAAAMIALILVFSLTCALWVVQLGRVEHRPARQPLLPHGAAELRLARSAVAPKPSEAVAV
jgi:hypothetical protein